MPPARRVSASFEATRDKKILAMGVDSDQYHDAPGFVLTSVTKQVDEAVFRTIKAVKDGQPLKGILELGLKEKGVDYVYDANNKALISPPRTPRPKKPARSSSPASSRSPPNKMAAAVLLSSIVKRYPRVTANDGATLSVASGSIHALLGENGAGKSTLMKILYGMARPDEGVISIRGEAKKFSGPQDAIAAGIGMVHQHFMLVSPLSVAENVALGCEPSATGAGGLAGVWDASKARADVARLSKQYGLKVDPNAIVENLSVGEQQRVEIVKILYRGAKILILDEPTAVLTPQEAGDLFVTLRRLRDAGLDDHLHQPQAQGSDGALRRGHRDAPRQDRGERRISQTSIDQLAALMVGDLGASRARRLRLPLRGPGQDRPLPRLSLGARPARRGRAQAGHAQDHGRRSSRHRGRRGQRPT